MRRGSPFSMVSTVHDDPRRSGLLQDALYAFRMTEKILTPLGTLNLLLHASPRGPRVTTPGGKVGVRVTRHGGIPHTVDSDGGRDARPAA